MQWSDELRFLEEGLRGRYCGELYTKGETVKQEETEDILLRKVGFHGGHVEGWDSRRDESTVKLVASGKSLVVYSTVKLKHHFSSIFQKKLFWRLFGTEVIR